jgi:hypothetical protein
MRRLAANSIVVALLALLLAPASLLSESQKLCCRRAGMHHCEGTGGAASDQSSLNNNAAKCPMTCCASTAHAKFAAQRFHTSFYHGYAADTLVREQVAFHSDLPASNLRDRSPPFRS